MFHDVSSSFKKWRTAITLSLVKGFVSLLCATLRHLAPLRLPGFLLLNIMKEYVPTALQDNFFLNCP
jgi:hypothetical protein